MGTGNVNGGLGGRDDDSSDWEEASEEGSDSDALQVHGLPPGQNLLDIAAAAAAAHDHVDGFTKVPAIVTVVMTRSLPKQYSFCVVRSVPDACWVPSTLVQGLPWLAIQLANLMLSRNSRQTCEGAII